MKLPDASLTTDQKMQEFDVWITPSIGDIRQTRQFTNTLAAIVRAFDRLCEATKDFASEADITHARLAESLVALFAGKSRQEVLRILLDITSVLFLITGKSDNNAKCQFPLFLMNTLGQSALPQGRHRTKPATAKKPAETIHRVETIDIPRVLDSEKYMRTVTSLDHFATEQRKQIDTFLQFVLDDPAHLSQLWSLGKSYATLKPFGRSEALLSPLVVAQVRGSVAATGGHEPEMILRRRMTEWGLSEDTDFNSADVKLNDELKIEKEVKVGAKKVKTRAYDFALPYKIPKRNRKIFIQSQYYAGDSGSVSHKNVDQTTAARVAAKKIVGNDARFIEYVDGAGFFASLNGDLRSLLDMTDTASFIQLRSIPIRLRREFQKIGFLTPIEIEHAILMVGPERKAIEDALVKDGYTKDEIQRAIDEAIRLGHLAEPKPKHLGITEARRPQARRYFLLDLAAIKGKTLTKTKSVGAILVPGYGPFHGLPTADLRTIAVNKAASLRADWARDKDFQDDLEWLEKSGFAICKPASPTQP